METITIMGITIGTFLASLFIVWWKLMENEIKKDLEECDLEHEE